MTDKKVLVYNIMQFPAKVKFFNEGVEREVKIAGVDVEYIEPLKPGIVDRLDEFTHLIISGSEASATDDEPWTMELEKLIRMSVENDKKILAICYGHQFLARVLAGKACIYKLAVPEYGYTKVRLVKHYLFENIADPVCVQLHYDAIRNLPENFEIIAENDTCIQAFQYDKKDIYGVQFHPEFDQESTNFFLQEARNANPNFPDFYSNELTNESVLEQNGLFIRNFLKM